MKAALNHRIRPVLRVVEMWATYILGLVLGISTPLGLAQAETPREAGLDFEAAVRLCREYLVAEGPLLWRHSVSFAKVSTTGDQGLDSGSSPVLLGVTSRLGFTFERE